MFGRILTILLLMALLAGCGSSSGAPPLSLPAPATGKITISSPDEDGYIHVEGTDGAVTGDSTVMVINENLEAGLMDKFLNPLMGVAYASDDSFPDVCSETGHACGLASSAGAFTILILGEEDHVIIVVLIDPTTGEELSDRIRQTVPRNVLPFVQQPVDVAYNSADYLLYVLLRGDTSQTPSVPNRVASIDIGTGVKTPIDMGGYDARAIGWNLEKEIVSITDSSEGFVYVGPVESSALADSRNYIAVESPMDVAFSMDSAYALVASDSSNYSLSLIDIDGRSVYEHSLFDSGYTDSGCVAVDVGYIGDYEAAALLCHFSVDGSDIYGVGVMSYEFGRFVPAGDVKLLPSGLVAKDVAIVNGSDILVSVEAANEDLSDALLLYGVSIESNVDINSKGVINSGGIPGENEGMNTFSVSLTEKGAVADPNGLVIKPRMIEVACSNSYAFVGAIDGDKDHPDSVLTVDLSSMTVVARHSAGHGPSGMAWDSENEILYICGTYSKTITKYTLSELITAE